MSVENVFTLFITAVNIMGISTHDYYTIFFIKRGFYYVENFIFKPQ